MKPKIGKVWTFASDSNPKKEYETLQYTDGATFSNCLGCTRRVAADGSRSCKHTRLVDMGRADQHCTSNHTYEPQPQHQHQRQNNAKLLQLPRLGQRKFFV